MVKIFTLRADSSADLQEVWRVTSAILPASDTMKIFIGCDTCYEIVREGDNNKIGVTKFSRRTWRPVGTAVFMRDQLFEIGTTVCTSSFRT